MFARIKRLYDAGKLDDAGVRNAVEKGMITPAQYKEITGHDYE